MVNLFYGIVIDRPQKSSVTSWIDIGKRIHLPNLHFTIINKIMSDVSISDIISVQPMYTPNKDA